MIKTTVVGSYPVPMWLRLVSNRESLVDAILAVLKIQELAGIDVVADGELYRWDINHAETNGMIEYFVRPMSGVNTKLTFQKLAGWRSRHGMEFRAAPPGAVNGPLGSGSLDLCNDYQLYRDLTTRAKKFTVTSPYMLAKTLVNDYYPDLESLVMAIADVLHEQILPIDADVVQVDEANITGNPHDAAIAAAGINRTLAAVKQEKAVHLCFGNYGGQPIQRGNYDNLIDFLNMLEADHVVLESARRPKDELSIFSDIKHELGLGIGVIDIKDNEVETSELVARRIEQVAAKVGSERINYVHPDCGFWMLPRSVADAKMRALVKGRDLFVGQVLNNTSGK